MAENTTCNGPKRHSTERERSSNAPPADKPSGAGTPTRSSSKKPSRSVGEDNGPGGTLFGGIPAYALMCRNCGFMRLHALKFLLGD